MLGNQQGWFGLAAGAASIGGLVFSILAWWRADTAARAAEDAREAVRRDSAREDLHALSVMAEELLSLAQSRQFEATLVRSRDRLAGIRRARARWASHLNAESAQNLGTAAKRAETISMDLSATGIIPSQESSQKVVQFCHLVVRILSEESGWMARLVEEKSDD